MDGPKFDDLARALGQGTSRRRLLRGVAGGVAGLVAGAVARTDAGVAAQELTICHATGDPNAPYQTMTIPQTEMNLHARQGDFARVECCADSDCPNQYGECGHGTCLTGYCVQLPVAAGSPCDPGLACVTGGVCDGAFSCTGSGVPVICPETENSCTTSICSEAASGCQEVPANVGASCDTDGLVCTTQTCQADGTCGGETPVDCPDTGDACLFAAGCQEPDGCVVIPLDDTACTTASGVAGACVAGVCTPYVCDNAVLAGAGGSTEEFLVDDDLEVFVNDVSVFVDNSELADFLSPIPLGPLVNGDTVRVVASNSTLAQWCTNGGEYLDKITLYCPSTGKSQVVNPDTIIQDAVDCGHVFFDETVPVSL